MSKQMIVTLDTEQLAELIREAVAGSKTNKTNTMLKINEISEYLRVDRRTVLRYVNKEGMPYYRLNSQELRFDISEIRKWMRERAEKNNSGKAA